MVRVFDDKKLLGEAAAEQASKAIRRAISAQGMARIIAATGTSQLDFLDALTRDDKIDWRKVELFHLDEYVGLPLTHPASFRKYLFERLIHKVGITNHHLLDGTGDANETVRVVGEALRSAPVDVALILKAKEIICVVPDARKAAAVKLCFEGEITPMAPSSILRTHPAATIYLDRASASLLSPGTISALTATA